MKIIRLIAYIFLGLVFVVLVLGNLFYQDIRRLVDRNYAAIEMSDMEMAKLEKNKNQDYQFVVFSDKTSYSMFEKIKVFARVVKKSDGTIPGSASVVLEFYHNGARLKDMGGADSVKLVYSEAQKLWIGFWYPGSGIGEGDIDIVARGSMDTPQAPLVAEHSFTIREQPDSYSIKKGLAFIGIDSQERISKRSLLSTDGKESDWSYITEWMDWVSADGILMMGGITKTFEEETTIENPWEKDKLDETLVLAERVKKRDKKFGVWLKALRVEGIYAKKLGYRPSLYFQDERYIEDNGIISITDDTRKKSIIKLFSSLMDNNNVAYVGISDMFLPQNYGVELLERFVKEQQIEIPSGWYGMDFDGKFQYFSAKVKDQGIYKDFILWKQYIVAEYLRDVIDKSGHKKPVFYFVDYKEILSNPDIISVVLNSGVDFMVVDFNIGYDTISSNLQVLNGIARVSPYFNRIIVSYYMDYKNTDLSDFELSAVENYVNANMNLVKYGSEYMNAAGIMINDLYKAMFGKRGPYSPYEWLVGVGETIFEFKNMNRPYNVDVEVYMPESIKYAEVFHGRIKVRNLSTAEVNNFKIEFLPLMGARNDRNTPVTMGSIGPGKEIYMDVPLQILQNNTQFVRKKNFVAMRVSWNEGSVQRAYITFKPISINKGMIPVTNVNQLN